jgi:hypothetical protein
MVENQMISINGKRIAKAKKDGAPLTSATNEGGDEPKPTFMSDSVSKGSISEIDYTIFKIEDVHALRDFEIIQTYAAEHTDHFWLVAVVTSDFLKFPPGSTSVEDKIEDYIPSIRWMRSEINKKEMVNKAKKAYSGWTATSSENIEQWMEAYRACEKIIPTIRRQGAAERNHSMSWWTSPAEATSVRHARSRYRWAIGSPEGREDVSFMRRARAQEFAKACIHRRAPG